MENKRTNKLLKILKVLAIIFLFVLVIEGLFILYVKFNNKTVYLNKSNSIIKTDNGYVSVGSSDFKNSKYHDYIKNGYEKGIITLYDKSLKNKDEIQFLKGYNVSFNDIISVSDGYIIVGDMEVTKEHNKNNTGEATILKYDKDFKLVWRKNFQVLDDSKFVKVKETKDGNYVVVGTSVYGSGYIGNHTTGGAILVKYDKSGNELYHFNLGGPKTGIFNDVIEVDDGYIVVGKQVTNTGIIIKYDYKGNIKWKEYYGYTDTNGLTSIKLGKNNNIYITGSTMINKASSQDSKALLMEYSLLGEKLNEVTYEKDDINRFENLLIDDEKIVVIGSYGHMKDSKTSTSNACILMYDLSLKKIDETIYVSKKSETFKKVIKDNKDYLVVGYTNSKIKNQKTNGKDIFPINIKYNNKLKEI